MTKLATRETQLAKFRLFLTRPDVLAQFHRAIRPGHDTNAQAVARIVLTTLSDPKNKKLLECTEQSVCASVVTALALGLEPDNVSGLAYLVPYGNICTLVPGYQGLIQLAYNSGQVADWSTYNVYSKEPFDRDTGRDQEIGHTPLPPSRRGEFIGSYTKVKLNTGGVHYEWMWDEEIEAIRKRAPAGDTGGWVSDKDEMRRKTVDRRATKRIPSSPTLRRAVALDEQAERGQAQDLDMIDVEPIGGPEDAPKKKTLNDFAAPKKGNGNPAGEPVAPSTDTNRGQLPRG